MAGRMINGAAALAELVRPAGETDTPGVHRLLPVAPELSGLLPGRGLRRGSTVAVATGSAAPAGGGTSLLLALLAEASRAGSWCAIVGVPSVGAIAAAESGIALDRLALIPNPGPDWPTVVAALIDGVDLVVTAVPGGVSASIASRLAARARQRGSVLLPCGPWPGADVTLRVTAARWEGLGAGHGRLRRREVTVRAQGRGAAARPREATMWMPGLTIRPQNPPPAGSGPGRPAPASVAPSAGAGPGRATPVSAVPPVGAGPGRVAPVSVAPSMSSGPGWPAPVSAGLRVGAGPGRAGHASAVSLSGGGVVSVWSERSGRVSLSAAPRLAAVLSPAVSSRRSGVGRESFVDPVVVLSPRVSSRRADLARRGRTPRAVGSGLRGDLSGRAVSAVRPLFAAAGRRAVG